MPKLTGFCDFKVFSKPLLYNKEDDIKTVGGKNFGYQINRS